ncbi:MAG: hypothetical protein IIZ66_04045 [Clostridia bacterium]|nr:hypothetical protein [Clostridia bacterium]
MGAVFDHKAWRHAGPVYGDLAVGDITQLNINGVATDFIVVHQGNPSSAIYDASCDGTWLLAKDIYENRAWQSSAVNSYGASSLHTYLNGTFLALCDAAVQSAIMQAKIPYVNGTGSAGSVASGASGLSTKVFLLGGYELGWTQGNISSLPADGAKLDYFEAGAASSANALRIAYLSGAAAEWWTRSPVTTNATAAESVETTGAYRARVRSVLASLGIRPCLIMPAAQKIFS